jgi:hypothetical protein
VIDYEDGMDDDDVRQAEDERLRVMRARQAEVDFCETLCGIAPSEVMGLLAKMMRQEFYLFRTSTGGKRVRKWKGELLGINVEVTEVDTGSMPLMGFDNRMSSVDYHVENVEWEFRVCVGGSDSYVRDDVPQGNAKLGKHRVKVSYPWFEGDEDTYRSDMSLIRLMGLNNDDEDSKEVMI